MFCEVGPLTNLRVFIERMGEKEREGCLHVKWYCFLLHSSEGGTSFLIQALIQQVHTEDFNNN